MRKLSLTAHTIPSWVIHSFIHSFIHDGRELYCTAIRSPLIASSLPAFFSLTADATHTQNKRKGSIVSTPRSAQAGGRQSTPAVPVAVAVGTCTPPLLGHERLLNNKVVLAYCFVQRNGGEIKEHGLPPVGSALACLLSRRHLDTTRCGGKRVRAHGAQRAASALYFFF